ncbi:pyruvate dehydrogenase complex dihydrolipoamide acetyltransferase [Wolbachia endosymbiont of Pentidionis agamae]|uniref:pyruvate dehydrogenase complex dihydrolipoamide acetyltransferase n=1 Tax=Wolbachia endosymbiont of Pentidionis agamae TaxID=3110435 RepID=UPI002FD23D6F
MSIEILMPALSPTMNKTGGKIVKWHKKEGERVEVGDVIAEIETDKAIMEFESVDEGIMAKILIPEGTSNVQVNQVIALMLEEGEDLNTYLSSENKKDIQEENQDLSMDSASNSSVKHVAIDEKKLSASSVMEENIKDRIKISPLAKKIAQDKNIDVSSIKGTGPYGRIVRNDVLKTLDHNTTTLNNTGKLTEVSNMRKVIAERLTESKQTIPHFYLTLDCKLDKLLLVKNEVNAVDSSNRVTINDFIIKAVALSMKSHSDINSSWIDNKILKYSSIDIAVAVALDDGLITPIIKDADKKSISCVSKEMKDLVNRAKSGKLKPEEFQGGGLTISNLGMFGIKCFSAIINPPQSCIMAVGKSEKQPVVINNKLEIVEIISITLSVDHRVVDGVLAAKFLNTFKNYIENPIAILI